MSLTTQDLTNIRSIIIDAFETLSTPRFDALEGRMGRLEVRMDRLEARMHSLEQRVSTVELGLRETNQRLNNVEQRLGSVERTVENIDGRLMAVEADIKELYKAVYKLDHPAVGSNAYTRMSDKQKITVLDKAVTQLAGRLGVQL